VDGIIGSTLVQERTVAQQPNIELDQADLPRSGLEPSAARPWSVSSKPGVIMAPSDVPKGRGYGTPGPDTGWALKIIRKIEGSMDPDLEGVLAALMGARAALFGRAPVPGDLAAAKLLAGMGPGLPPALTERLQRWLAAVPHERSKGRTAVSDVDPDLLTMSVDDLRLQLTNRM
jgi:hypothetical protein